ncbi:MAG TPA: hypothetical protein VGA30_07395 [Actinomycetota bacterium]
MAAKSSGSSSASLGGSGFEIQDVSKEITYLPPLYIPPAPPPVRVMVQDNTQIIEKVDFSGLLGALKRPTRTVVVGQTPEPGEQVPLGTQVTLTLAVKDTLPLSNFGLMEQVRSTWPTAGDLVGAVEKPLVNPQTDAQVKVVFASGKSYGDLSQADRSVVDGFINERVGLLSADDKARAYEDIAFVYGL